MTLTLAFLAFLLAVPVAAGLITHVVLLAVASRQSSALRQALPRPVPTLSAPLPHVRERTLQMDDFTRATLQEQERTERWMRCDGMTKSDCVVANALMRLHKAEKIKAENKQCQKTK